MQKLSDRIGFPTVMRHLRFTSIRLRSRPETAGLAQEVDELRGGIQTANEAHAMALEERVAASAEVAYLDGCLDRAVMDLAREIGVMTQGRAEDPRHGKLFPAAPSELIRPIAGETQGRFVRSLLSRLREDKDYGHLLHHAETIERTQQALDAAVERRRGLYQPEVKAQTDRRIALDHARALYNTLSHRLTLLYPTDRALVRSFFLHETYRNDRDASDTGTDDVVTDETTGTPV